MTTGTKTATKKDGKPVKEKIFHPNSRKAGQLERASLRKSKLASASSKRSIKQIEKADRIGFWFHAMPPEAVTLTLAEIHDLIQTSWLTRHDEQIQSEAAARRKGRPSSAREVELKALKVKEEEEYRSGIEIPDLTHEPTVELFRSWNGDMAYLHLLRFIRVSRTDPDHPILVRLGLQEREKLKATAAPASSAPDEMDLDTAVSTSAASSGLSDVPLSRFSSTIQSMNT